MHRAATGLGPANRAGGVALTRAIAIAYEIHVALVRAIDLHSFKKDHVAHLAPAIAAGAGSLMGVAPRVIYEAINQAVHLSFATRQSRKGDISSWKAYAPAQAGKIAVEALDRAMRGEGAPNPIYEGEDSIIPWMLAGKDAHDTPSASRYAARRPPGFWRPSRKHIRRNIRPKPSLIWRLKPALRLTLR